MSTRTSVSPSRDGSARSHSAFESDAEQRAERHVAGDAAERIENGDAHAVKIRRGLHQKRYEAPLPC